MTPFSMLVVRDAMLSSALTATDERFYQTLDECGGCARRMTKRLLPHWTPESAVTTCSMATARLGSGQTVIAYTYYEGPTYDIYGRDYFAGVEQNVRKIGEVPYPREFRIRLYYRLSSTSPTRDRLCALACEDDSRLDLCDVENLPGRRSNVSDVLPVLWRFLPVVDPQVDLYFSRDLDSHLGARELAAVGEFLADKEAAVHVMRDHWAHDIGILAGTWGAKLEGPELRKAWRISLRNMLANRKAHESQTVQGADQYLLNRYVWPWAKRKMLAHDSYTCEKYPKSVGFPTRRIDANMNFVGAVLGHGDRIEFAEENACPERCRRNATWTFC